MCQIVGFLYHSLSCWTKNILYFSLFVQARTGSVRKVTWDLRLSQQSMIPVSLPRSMNQVTCGCPHLQRMIFTARRCMTSCHLTPSGRLFTMRSLISSSVLFWLLHFAKGDSRIFRTRSGNHFTNMYISQICMMYHPIHPRLIMPA